MKNKKTTKYRVTQTGYRWYATFSNLEDAHEFIANDKVDGKIKPNVRIEKIISEVIWSN